MNKAFDYSDNFVITYFSISPENSTAKISLISWIRILTSGINSIKPSGTKMTP